jgi:hypothetical protein
MTSITGLNARSLDIRRAIHCTQTFWQLNRQYLLMQLTSWRQTAGSAPRRPSLVYSTIQSIRKLYTQHNNSEAKLEPGGLPTLPPYLLIIMFHGASSVLLSILITYLRVCFVAR